MKALSEIIAFLILLFIILFSIPVALIILSQPSSQEQQIESVQPYKNIALQQYNELKPLQVNSSGVFVSPVLFAYNESNNEVCFILISNSSLSVPIVVDYLLVFNGSQWIKLNIIRNGTSLYAEQIDENSSGIAISPSNANSVFENFPIIKIQLVSVVPFEKQASYIAITTQYGNIIYATQSSEIQQFLSYL